MINIVFASDIVQENGKTVRENNMEISHKIPIGSLVEVNYNCGEEEEGLRLWVVNHSRDCDGTPLYDLSFSLDAQQEYEQIQAEKEEAQKDSRDFALWSANYWNVMGKINRHYSEESLIFIK